MRNRVAADRGRDGVALLTTLVLVSAIVIVVVGLFSISRQESEIASIDQARMRAEFAEKAAFEDAASLLRSVTREDGYLVTSAIEGNGPDLTRYHFVSVPGAGSLVHIPLFAGGTVDRGDMPNLDAKTTGSLVSDPVARPRIRFENREAVDRIRTARLTHLAASGETFVENARPPTGFVDLEPADAGETSSRPGSIASRYTYWIEDLEGYPSLDTATRAGHHVDAEGKLFPDPVRGGYSRFDSRTDPEAGDPAGLRLAFEGEPSVQYSFPKSLGGQSRLDQAAPGLDPSELAPVSWAVPGLPTGEHPYDHFRDAASRPFHSIPGDVGSPSTEWNRFSSGISAYLHRPLIPYGHAYPDEGRPRFNLNRLVADADMEVAEIIERNLPAFEERKGGFPPNPTDPDVADYTATIAANLIDYADENSTPSLPSTTEGAGNRVFRGVDGYCPVNEFFVEFEYVGYSPPEDGEYELTFRARVWAEFWNPFRNEVVMENVGIDFHFLDVPRFQCFTAYWLLEPSRIVTNEPRDQPVVEIALEPNEIRVVPFGAIEWKVPVGNTGSLPIAFPIVENLEAQPAAGSVNPRANYELLLAGVPVDRAGRSPKGVDDAHGFFFYKHGRFHPDDPFMRVGGSVPRLKEHGSGTVLTGGHGIQGTTLGDPWMNYLTESTFDNFRFRTAEYRNHSSPGARNFSRRSAPSTRRDSYSDQVRVRDWPDRGYENPVGSSPGSDSEPPDDPGFVLETDPRRAPWVLSNRGRYFSASEIGNIHDPIMWVYGEADATRYLGSQSYEAYRDTYLAGLPEDAEPNPRWGGGNTLRVGRPEHEKFDRPGMRASQLLDLFQAGFNGTNLEAVDDAERDLLYERFDPALHRLPPTAPEAGEAAGPPYDELYRPELHARGDFEYRLGRLNLNTAPTLFEIESLLRGPLVSSDLVVVPGSESNPVAPDYTDEADLGYLEKRLDPDSVAPIAGGLFRARPFYSPSHLARVLSELIEEHDALPEHHNDAEAEETFARIFNTTSFTSRHFRLYTYAETYEESTDTVLARSRRVYEVFLEPIRDASGEVERSRLRVLKTYTP